MYCRRCGKIVKEFDNYCMNCGERIKDEISIYYPFNEYEETRKCESCHQNIPVKAKFCPHCKARKRKHANYPLITKLLIINIVLILEICYLSIPLIYSFMIKYV